MSENWLWYTIFSVQVGEEIFIVSWGGLWTSIYEKGEWNARTVHFKHSLFWIRSFVRSWTTPHHSYVLVILNVTVIFLSAVITYTCMLFPFKSMILVNRNLKFFPRIWPRTYRIYLACLLITIGFFCYACAVVVLSFLAFCCLVKLIVYKFSIHKGFKEIYLLSVFLRELICKVLSIFCKIARNFDFL